MADSPSLPAPFPRGVVVSLADHRARMKTRPPRASNPARPAPRDRDRPTTEHRRRMLAHLSTRP